MSTISDCCHAQVEKGEQSTSYYICSRCGKSCDIMENGIHISSDRIIMEVRKGFGKSGGISYANT